MKQRNVGYALLACCALFGFVIANGAYAADTALCKGCHGVPDNETAPNIAGMSAKYIASSLNKYRERLRPCDLGMCDMAASLSDEDIEDLARQFAAEKFVPADQKTDPALVAKGKKIHDKNCEKCHLGGGAKVDDAFGILAGQKMTYLRNQIDYVLAGTRKVHRKMLPRVEALSKDDIEAVIQYYGSQK